MSKITINGISVDPQAQAPTLARLALVSEDASQTDYILVQTRVPLTRSEREQLQSTGAEPLEYVPENTYICRFPASDLRPIRKLAFVAWANPYLHTFKIAPRLRRPHSSPTPNDLLRLHATQVGSITQQPQLVDVVLHRGVDPQSVRDELARAAGVESESFTQLGAKLRVRVQPQRLVQLSAIDAVRHIEPVIENKLFNNAAVRVLGADVVHRQLELQGEGEVVAVCDTGFDLGSETDTHPAFRDRVLKLYALGRNTAADPHGHGTHVCGSVLGDGTSASLGQIRGTAPRAKLVVQSVLDSWGGLGGLPDDLTQLFDAPYTNDAARVHSNSWGAAAAGAYTSNSYEVDAFVWEHRDMVIVFAAGNEGVDRNANGVVDNGSVGAPGTAKNCITVGASENDRPDFAFTDGPFSFRTYGEGWPDDYPVDPIASDRLADDADGLAAFSSRGPTRDGRIKPDVVAPGTGILSTRSRARGVGSGWGLSADPLYFYEGGTSMATPLVSGCAAVLRQYFKRQHRVAQPSAALIKAILINTAENLSGQYRPTEAGAIPNVAEGFGRVNLHAAVAPAAESGLFEFWDEASALDTGEEQTFTLQLGEAVDELKITLVWTDPPGETLQNDLDLIVTTPTGSERHGNMRGNARAFDRQNNVEQVRLTRAPAGTYSVRVHAYRVALHAQSFALVVRAR